MNIAILGATGNVGSRLTTEALSRGHKVTAIARSAGSAGSAGKIEAKPGLTVKATDLTDTTALAHAVSGYDAVLLAVRFQGLDAAPLLDAIKQAHTKRLLVVGGAGSLQVPGGGIDVVDTPNFPAEYKPEATAAREFLHTLRKEATLDWTMISPSAMLVPGTRTGKFRIGDDQLLVDAAGKSEISMEDLSVALIDELEQHKHSRKRFTAGY